MNPLVSVIIPTYNRANLIGETLDSLLAQTYINWECIIVDDGSTDNTHMTIAEYLKIDTRFQYHHRPETKLKGPSSCRNYGLDIAKGEYVIFLDSDDLLAGFCIESRIKFAIVNQDYDFWIFKMLAFEGTIKNVKFFYENIQEENESSWCKKEFMKGANPFVVTGPFWKKKVLQELNGFNEYMTMIEDPELHLRALKMGYQLKFANIENPDCFYRLNNKTIKYTLDSELENALIFFNLHLNKNDKEIFVSLKKTFNNSIFENKKYSFYFKFCNLGFKRGIFSLNNILLGLFVLLYKSLGLDKFKGFGYHSLKNTFNNF